MDYEKQARNYRLMGAIRNGDLLKVRDLLNDRADINFVNQHGNNETPLHEAVLSGNLEMIKYLLENGADGKAKTKDGKKPIDFCENLDVQQADLVRAVFNEHYSTCKSPKDDQQQQLEYDADSSVSKDTEGTYTKRPGTTCDGNFYEIKILTLVLFRLLHDDQIESFYLATNLEEAGYFDDVILRTYYGGKPRVYLLQVKHRSANRPINFDDMINKKGTSMRRNNGFNLDKYFESYLNIRYMHSRTNDNPIFQGLFDQTDLEMIIYTNAKINYKENVFYDRTNDCNLVHSKNSGKSVRIGLTHELIDHFTKLSKKWHLKTISDIVRRLTKIQNIDTSNLNSDVIESHGLKTILKFFFKNNYDINGLNLVEQYGNPDLLSAYTRNTRKINESIANMIDEAHLPTLDYHLTLVEEFFGKLRIYSEQAAKNEMEEIIKNEIQVKYGRFGDEVFSNLYSAVESWWRQSGSVPYLTKSCNLFKSVKKAANLCLMEAIRKGDLVKVRDLLDDGADINFVNPFGNNETPLHEAVLSANLEMIKYLLENGADGEAKNKDSKKPIDFCENLDVQQADLVKAVFNEHYSTCKLPKYNQQQQLEYDADSSDFKSVEYDKRPGTYTERLGKYNKQPVTTVIGIIYKIKILTMVLFRLLHDDQIESFYLATNLEEAGYFDDVILRTYDGGKPRVYLLQVKHRSTYKHIKFEDMINKKGTLKRWNNGFNLDKHFESYLNIRYMHSRTKENPIFQGLFDQTDLEMIIYTNAKINYKENVFYDRTNNCNLVHSKNSGKSVRIGLTHELIDHFTKLSQQWHLKTISDIVRRLTKIQNIDSSNLNSDVIKSHRLKTILESFFKNNDDINGLNLMEQYGNPDLLSGYTRNTRKINESIANMIDEAHLPTLDYHVSLVEEFFGKLRIYSEQAAENEMEEIIKNEIQAKHGRSSDVVFSNLYSVVESWWNKSGSVPYLTKSCSLLESVKRAANFNKDISLDKA